MTEKKTQKWWDRLAPGGRIDRRVFFWIMVILTAAIYLRPIGLPVIISERVEAAYKAVDKLPKGSLVLYSLESTGGAWPEIGPAARACLSQLMDKQVKFVIIGFEIADVSAIQEGMIDQVGLRKDPRYKYGVDWLAFGYVPGREAAVVQMSEDFHGLLKVDFYGNKLTDLPLAQQIKDAKNFAMVINMGHMGEIFIRQWGTRYGIPIIGMGEAGEDVELAPYYPEVVKGIVAGIRGGAEYELLTKKPGEALINTDILSANHVVVIVFIVIGNILYWTERRRGS